MATQMDNYGLHAVPAPGKGVIDGELSDWDRSGGALFCYDMETFQERFSGCVSLMYNAENLYVAIRWKDEVPMGNIHDPRFQADTDARVMEVTGLDGIRRLNGKFTYTKAQYATAQKQAEDRAV